MGKMEIQFGNNLRAQRKKLGLTQEQLAEKLGYDRSTYSYYEIGRTEPSISTLCKLSRIFGVTLDQLVYPQPDGSAMKDAKNPPLDCK